MKHLPITIFLLTFLSCKDTNPNVAKVDSDSSKTEGKLIKFTPQYNFESFKTKLYTGKAAPPDFTGNEFGHN